MLKYYITFAIRNFRSNKVVLWGSLTTLCLGALCISLLFSYAYNELSMDNFHKREKDIYMVIMKSSPQSEWSTPYKFEAKEYPDIEKVVNVTSFQENETKIKFKESSYTPMGIVVDSSFFQIFDFKLLNGDPETVLNNRQGIILSEDFSKKLFGDEDPLGKSLDFEVRMYKSIHTVQGIVKIPSNSSFTFDYIIPYKSSVDYGKPRTVFFKSKPNFNESDFKNKIEKANNNVPNYFPNLTESTTSIIGLKDIYFTNELNSIKQYVPISSGSRKNVQVLIIIMIILFFISVLNFSNLQIVNTNAVIKSIAISKVNGAINKHIILQKLVENFILILFAGFIITVGYTLIMPRFNAFIGVPLEPPIEHVFLLNISVLLAIALFGMIYPTWLIIKYSKTTDLKQNLQISSKLKGRQATIIFQYSLAVLLLISGFIVNNQLRLMLNKDLGFSKDNIMKVKLFYEPPMIDSAMDEYRELMDQKPQYINNKLASYPSIEKISQGNSPIDFFSINWKAAGGQFDFKSINSLAVTPGYEDLFDLKLIEGRFFKDNIDEQRGKKIVINEAAKKYWGITDISQAKIENQFWGGKDGFEVIGIVKNFNYEHLSAKPEPLVMVYFDDPETEYFIKFHEGQTQQGIKDLEALFKEVNPNKSFKFSFLSDDIAALYHKEKRLSIIYNIFTFIALLISAIGIFTIALYDTQRRVKEIGIRRVNGATIQEIMIMLNKDFVRWILFAFVIACPVAYYAMSKWLENFAYKTELSWWIFVLAGTFTIVLALLTVSYQTYKAASVNPAESLRDE